VALEVGANFVVDGDRPVLAALTRSVSTDDMCRSFLELGASLEVVMEIDPVCVVTWVTRFELGSDSPAMLSETVAGRLGATTRLSQLVPQGSAYFAVDGDDGSIYNVFADTLSVRSRDLVGIADLLSTGLCVATYQQCAPGIACCSPDDECIYKNEYYSQCRPGGGEAPSTPPPAPTPGPEGGRDVPDAPECPKCACVCGRPART
jgi:hypothetical protein